MLITESSMKTNHVPASQSENSSTATTGSSNIVPAVPFQTTTTSTGTPPLRSRNQNRSDDKSEKADNASAGTAKGKNPPKPPDEFYRDLQQFHEKRG